jgi:tetratricopeptide (TPR) repeat protein
VPTARAPGWVAYHRPAGPPISLTASDGTGLSLREIDAKAVIEEPLAFTELHLAFDNPQARTLEGTFTVTLPPGAAVSRFAMRTPNGWQEGEVVEKKAARAAYEDFLHRKQDPALLEQAAGNQFSARVFPIPPRGTKEILLSYSQALTSAAPYVVPLQGLPSVERVHVEVSRDGEPMGKLERTSFVPDRDYEVDPSQLRSGSGLKSGNLAVVRVRPAIDTPPEPLTNVVYLVDTSASRALGFDAELSLVEGLVHGTQGKAAVVAFDQTTEVVFEGAAESFGASVISSLREREALGASDVGGALAKASTVAKEIGALRVVLVSDGVASAFETDPEKLGAVATSLRETGVERLDAVSVGGIHDDSLLKHLVTSGLERDGVVLDGADDVPEVLRRLSLGTRSGIPVEVSGARFSYPRRIDGAQPGDEVLVYAELDGATPLSVSVGGAKVDTSGLVAVERPLLARAIAQAKIADLLELPRGGEQAETRESEIVALSTEFRVLSPYTSMLVLESESDYDRFHIDRNALRDILTVDNGRIALQPRTGVGAPLLAAGNVPVARTKAAAATEEHARRAPEAPSVPMQAPVQPTGGGDPDNSAAATVGGGAAPPPSEPALASPPPPPPMAAPAAMRASGPSRMSADAEQSLGGVGTLGRTGAPAHMAARRPGSSSGFLNAPPPADKPAAGDPYAGNFKVVMDALARGDKEGALSVAKRWHREAPGDVLSVVAFGEALEAAHDVAKAGRVYGSIIDLFPARADLRRFAGARLERLHADSALALAEDTYEKAEAQRPDHPSSHRLLAYALLRQGRYAEAFEAAKVGAARTYPVNRFPGVAQILHEDLGLIAAAWIKAEPAKRDSILDALKSAGGKLEDAPSLRFVLSWETDANDVDFHIFDDRGGHAFYSHKRLPSGGDLYADITTGYGPECFTIRGPKERRAAKYTLQANYYSRGPMGYGMGKLEIVDHDGKGGLTFEERPYIVMKDHAFVDLGTIEAGRSGAVNRPPLVAAGPASLP